MKKFVFLFVLLVLSTTACSKQPTRNEITIETVMVTSSPIVTQENIFSEVSMQTPTSSPTIAPTATPNPCDQDGIGMLHRGSLEELEDHSGYTCNNCKKFVPKRYGFTQDDIYILAQLLCGDKNKDGDGEYDIDFGNSERYDQISLVLCVIMNRVRCDYEFPNTVQEVVKQKNQFSPMPRNLKAEPSEIALLRVTEWCEAYDRWDGGVQSIPEDHLYFTGDGLINHSSTTWK